VAETPLGLHAGTVRVVPYNLEWPELFAAERQRLEHVLAAHSLSLAIEHTGSTAVVGLSAKPVLDILAGWTSEDQRHSAITALQTAGYAYRGEQGIPERDFFRRGEPRQYHVHLARIDSRFWKEHRAFRDYLRTHDDVAAAYGALKRALAERYSNDRAAYIEGKTAFVEDVLVRALSTRDREP
jgi:GrpB-like predicted nucleotidyltransferase (UPF0157 family)